MQRAYDPGEGHLRDSVGPPVRREHRLAKRADFDRIRTQGRRVSAPELVMYHFARSEQERPRVGFAVGRMIGGAVVRNRTRRKLREATRRLLPSLVPCDLIVVARPPAAEAGVAALERALSDAAARAGLLQT